MSITIELPDDVIQRLSAEAMAQGLSLSEYLQKRLTQKTADKTQTTGAELVAYWQQHGVIGCRPDISDSQKHAREMRAQAERRARD